MTKEKASTVLTAVWVINILLLVMTALTDLAISPSKLIYLQIGIGVIGWPVKTWLDKRTYNSGLLAIVLAILVIIAAAVDGRGSWKTQTVVYQNLHLANRTIEFQMQDKGGRGYNRRTVDRIKLMPFVDWIQTVQLDNIDTLTWERADVHINELELKGP